MTEEKNDFVAQAAEDRVGLAAEFVSFLKDNKKWWLTPIVLVLGAFGLLVLLSGTAAAPFIYTIF